ncbi:MAG: efflux RND transporter periplasmic adaptor subunit [Rhizobiaceae bacterium]
MRMIFSVILLLTFISGCSDSGTVAEDTEPPVRGLKTVLIKESEETTARRYPSVLQPAEVTTLSFEVSGRLKEVSLDVGQRVEVGDLIAEIDTTSLQLQLESAQAALQQAQSSARNAKEDFERKEELFKKGVTTKAAVDQARTAMETSAAQVDQAQKQVETAESNLGKAELKAPFSGIINTVQVESFANVAAGSPVITLYAADTFEAAFSVSFDVVNQLAVGKKATIRLADSPDIVLQSFVSELGSRADTVSSFPVVVTLEEVDPSMKAGMAVEITLEFPVPRGQGYTLPLSVLPFEGQIKPPNGNNEPAEVDIFVFDPPTSTVMRRTIKVGGVRENSLIAVDGLELGERVASAGVSFLRDGLKVKLLPDDEG